MNTVRWWWTTRVICLGRVTATAPNTQLTAPDAANPKSQRRQLLNAVFGYCTHSFMHLPFCEDPFNIIPSTATLFLFVQNITSIVFQLTQQCANNNKWIRREIVEKANEVRTVEANYKYEMQIGLINAFWFEEVFFSLPHACTPRCKWVKTALLKFYLIHARLAVGAVYGGYLHNRMFYITNWKGCNFYMEKWNTMKCAGNRVRHAILSFLFWKVTPIFMWTVFILW